MSYSCAKEMRGECTHKKEECRKGFFLPIAAKYVSVFSRGDKTRVKG